MARSDPVYLRQLKRRDERAFDRLVVENQDAVVRYLTRMLGNRDEAMDLGQEVFLAAFRFIDKFRGDCSLKTWLFRIALNLCKNHIRYKDRRASRRQTSFDDAYEQQDFNPVGSHPESPEALARGRELQGILAEGLQQLPPDFREALILRDVELMSYDEVAELTGLPAGTVKSRIHRARVQLMRYVKRATDGDEA